MASAVWQGSGCKAGGFQAVAPPAPKCEYCGQQDPHMPQAQDSDELIWCPRKFHACSKQVSAKLEGQTGLIGIQMKSRGVYGL